VKRTDIDLYDISIALMILPSRKHMRSVTALNDDPRLFVCHHRFGRTAVVPCCGPNGSERQAVIALGEIVLAYFVTSALLIALMHMLLAGR
jgi:hypothetical protein